MSTLITPLSAQDIYSESSTQQFPLGQRGETNDGRVFRYCKAGGTSLVAGKIQQSSAEDTAFNGMAVNTAAAIGDTTVKVTLGGTAATAKQFSEGFLMTSDGYCYKVKSNPAQTSTTGSLTVTLEDSLLAALTTSSTATLVKNPYDSVIITPTSFTGAVVGVPLKAITNAYFGWLQVEGIASVLGDAAAPAVGDMVSPSNATAGACEVGVLAQGFVGNAILTGTSTAYRAVMLKI